MCRVLYCGTRRLIPTTSSFCKVLDIDKCGRLTPAAIRFFYSDVHDSLRASGYEAPSVDNVCVEVYDILGVSSEPTFQELVASEQGHTVIGMLLDTRYYVSDPGFRHAKVFLFALRLTAHFLPPFFQRVLGLRQPRKPDAAAELVHGRRRTRFHRQCVRNVRLRGPP